MLLTVLVVAFCRRRSGLPENAVRGDPYGEARERVGRQRLFGVIPCEDVGGSFALLGVQDHCGRLRGLPFFVRDDNVITAGWRLTLRSSLTSSREGLWWRTEMPCSRQATMPPTSSGGYRRRCCRARGAMGRWRRGGRAVRGRFAAMARSGGGCGRGGRGARAAASGHRPVLLPTNCRARRAGAVAVIGAAGVGSSVDRRPLRRFASRAVPERSAFIALMCDLRS